MDRLLAREQIEQDESGAAGTRCRGQQAIDSVSDIDPSTGGPHIQVDAVIDALIGILAFMIVGKNCDQKFVEDDSRECGLMLFNLDTLVAMKVRSGAFPVEIRRTGA